MIKIEKLVKNYGKFRALDNLDLYVEKGDILGLLGPNGSGKSTIINCMLSLLSFDSGSIKIFGEEMKPEKYNIKQRIGVVPQEVAVFEELSVTDNISYFCGLYIQDQGLRKRYVDEAIQLVGLEEFQEFYPKQLSGGLKRRLNIACGIAHKPELIFLDEPTVAVDPQSRNKILESIQQLNRMGSTIIYTTHYMEEVEILCNTIVILDHGRVIAKGNKEQLKQSVRESEKLVIEVIGLTEDQIRIIEKMQDVLSVSYLENRLSLTSCTLRNILLPILNFFKKENISYHNIYTAEATLNDVFLEITGKELRD